MSAAQHISRSIQNPNRIAGILLVGSFFVLVIALIILVASGALSAFSNLLQGSLEQMAPYAPTFRMLNLLWVVGWLVQLLGLGLFARSLIDAGDEYLALIAFIAVFVATILGVLHGTFHMSVETWAAEEAARTGSVPDLYQPLEAWIGSAFRVAYFTHLLATAAFGWSILRAGLLAPWVGQMVIGWSILWLVGGLIGVGAPGLLFIMPAAIGFALLRG
jgi:hypothetical protein